MEEGAEMLLRVTRLHSFLPRPRPKSERADGRQSFPLIEADERGDAMFGD